MNINLEILSAKLLLFTALIFVIMSSTGCNSLEHKKVSIKSDELAKLLACISVEYKPDSTTVDLVKVAEKLYSVYSPKSNRYWVGRDSTAPKEKLCLCLPARETVQNFIEFGLKPTGDQYWDACNRISTQPGIMEFLLQSTEEFVVHTFSNRKLKKSFTTTAIELENYVYNNFGFVYTIVNRKCKIPAS